MSDQTPVHSPFADLSPQAKDPTFVGIFADIVEKYGLAVRTREAMIAELFGVQSCLAPDKDFGELGFIIEIPENLSLCGDSWEVCRRRACASLRLLWEGDEAKSDAWGYICVKTRDLEKFHLRTPEQMFELLKRELRQRIDEGMSFNSELTTKALEKEPLPFGEGRFRIGTSDNRIMSYTKHVLLPDAQEPFRYESEEFYPTCAGVFADLAKTYGMRMLTKNDVIADLFGVDTTDNWEQYPNDLVLTVEIDRPDWSKPDEALMRSACESFRLLRQEDESETDAFGTLMVDRDEFGNGSACSDTEIFEFLNSEFKKLIDEYVGKPGKRIFVYNGNNHCVAMYESANDDKLEAVVSKDYPTVFD